MKIFLSHSSKDGDVAERLALALQQDEHDVFFDRRSLAPSDEYNRRIRDEITGCDLFVFLVSTASLREDSYARSELEIAKQRFAHPSGRVLPVMLEKIPPAELPPFLAAVTLFDPVGDVVAETAHAVEEIERTRRKRRIARWMAVVPAVVGLAGIAVWKAQSARGDDVRLEVVAFERVRRDLELGGDVYAAVVNVRNEGSTSKMVMWPSIECSSEEVFVHDESDPAERTARPLETNSIAQFRVPLAFVRTFGDDDAFLERDLPRFRWRARVPFVNDVERTTDWLEFGPAGVFDNGALHPIDAAVRERVRFVAQGDQTPRDSIAFATVDPPELWDMDAGGRLRRVAPLDEEPTALAASGDCIAVGSAGSIRLFVGPTAELRGPYALVPVAVSGEPGDERAYSIVPRSLAVRTVEETTASGDGEPHRTATDLEVWVRTYDESAPPFLARFSSLHETITMPFAAGWPTVRATASEHSNELGLRVIDGDVSGASSAWGPGRLVTMIGGDFSTARADDVALVACAWDVAPAPGGGFLLIDCDRNLVLARHGAGTIAAVQTLAKLPLEKGTPTTRETQHLSVCRGRVLIAINRSTMQPPESGTQLFTWTIADGVEHLAALDLCETVGLATLERSGCAVLRMANGTYQAVRIDYSIE